MAGIVKSQCTTIEKAAKGKTISTAQEVVLLLSHLILLPQAEQDTKLMELVVEQTKAWTELMQRHRCRIERRKAGVGKYWDRRRNIMEVIHAKKLLSFGHCSNEVVIRI